MTFSYYYADPDGNHVELQVDNFGDWSKSTEWMRTSEEFKANPIGVFVDPDRVAADHAEGAVVRGDPREGDGRRLRARAGARRDPGGVMKLCRFEADGQAAPRHGRGRRGRRSRDAAIATRSRTCGCWRRCSRASSSAIGLNYADHIAESGMEAPEFPVFFNKQVTCVVGPGRRRPHAARVQPARLRGRAGDRDRQPLPPRARRSARTR